MSVADASPQGCQDANNLVVSPAPLSDAAHVQALIATVKAVPNPTTPPGTPTFDAYSLGTERVQAFVGNPPAGFENASAYVVFTT